MLTDASLPYGEKRSAGRLLVFGAGGHGRVVLDAALAVGSWQTIHVSDRDPSKWGLRLASGVTVRHPQDDELRESAIHVAIGDNGARRREAKQWGVPWLTAIVHPRAVVSATAHVRAGAFVAAGAIIGPDAQVGEGCIINHGAIVDHGCQVGAYSHVAPGATLGGDVVIGTDVLLGARSVLLPGVRVADGTIVGAGCVVCRSIDEAGVYAGVPARRIR